MPGWKSESGPAWRTHNPFGAWGKRVRDRITARRRRQLRWPIILAISLSVTAFSALPTGFNLDQRILSQFFKLRGPIAPPDDIVLIGLNKDTTDFLNNLSEDREQWPSRLRECDNAFGGLEHLGSIEDFEWLPRSVYACMVRILDQQGAALVAFDVLFKDSPAREAGNASLIRAFRDFGKVISLSFAERIDAIDDQSLQHDVVIKPHNDIANAAARTAPFVLPRPDGPTLAFWTRKSTLDEPIQIPLAALTVWNEKELQNFGKMIDPNTASGTGQQHFDNLISYLIGHQEDVVEPLLEAFSRSGGDGNALRNLYALYHGQASHYLNYFGPSETIPILKLHDILASESASVALDLEGKAVFIGYHETRRSQDDDTFQSPFTGRIGTQISGVEIAATAFANLRDRQTISLPVEGGRLAIIFSITALIVFACMSGNHLLGLLRGAGFALVYGGSAFFCFVTYNLFLPIAGPIMIGLPLAMLVAQSVHYAVARRWLQAYASRQVSKKLLSGDSAELDNQQMPHVSVMMTDIVNYTGYSERHSSIEVTAFINQHLSLLISAVEANQGLVNEFQGDAIMAIWGAPVAEPYHATFSCLAAIDIAKAIAENNREILLRGEQPIRLRIGINSGDAYAGAIGTEGRQTFTVVGDVVNSAKRIETLGKDICSDNAETTILISEATASALDTSFKITDCGTHNLRGRQEPVRIYRLWP